MKKIRRTEIIKQVDEAHKEVRQWCQQDWRHYAKMMIDTDDASIWADLFLEVGAYKTYPSDTVKDLEYQSGYVSETVACYIEDAVRLLTDAGWEITE